MSILKKTTKNTFWVFFLEAKFFLCEKTCFFKKKKCFFSNCITTCDVTSFKTHPLPPITMLASYYDFTHFLTIPNYLMIYKHILFVNIFRFLIYFLFKKWGDIPHNSPACRWPRTAGAGEYSHIQTDRRAPGSPCPVRYIYIYIL